MVVGEGDVREGRAALRVEEEAEVNRAACALEWVPKLAFRDDGPAFASWLDEEDDEEEEATTAEAAAVRVEATAAAKAEATPPADRCAIVMLLLCLTWRMSSDAA